MGALYRPQKVIELQKEKTLEKKTQSLENISLTICNF